MVSQGVAIQIFKNFASIFQALNGQTSPLKDQFGKKKEARDVMYYHH
jgi:hypothetical protein